MSTHKHIDKICLVAAILSLLLTLVFANGKALGIQVGSRVMGYENRLFDTSQVHTLDIVMDDWDSFLETCENEEYEACSVVIDGETFKNVGIRAKGNTSLSNVSSLDSDRYSFKIEFDQYDSTKSYHDLDKLSLNNLIQDSTMMKDYLTYQMMGQFGVAAPLCSYVYITVNGEDWGLYLAVEGVEESFLQRNYGSDYGDLYKPDSMNFGGGPGNGQGFDMESFLNKQGGDTLWEAPNAENSTAPQISEGFDPSTMFGNSESLSEFDQQREPMNQNEAESETSSPGDRTERSDRVAERGGGHGGGMGSDDAKLQYFDDNPDSYSTIFSSAKTDVTDADQTRLIQSLKTLSEGESIEQVVAVEDVIRYFVVHNFVVNGDSYTGSMIHNYYLYEEDGRLSMIPWDYNLAFGTFQGSNATETVNTPIDTPVSGGTGEDRPMVGWIFSSEVYTQLYHQYFAEFLENTDFAVLIDETAQRIAPYVEKDPSKFYSYEAFETGVAAIREFCLLREESVRGQLDGTIPATTQGQSEDSSALIDASHITISDMGSMGGMGGGAPGGRENSGFERQSMKNQLSASGEQSDFSKMETDAIPLNVSEGEGPDAQPSDIGDLESVPEGNGSRQMADGMGFPGAVDGNFSALTNGAFSGGPGTEMNQPSNSTTLFLLSVSFLILAAGLWVAFKFKR